MEFFLMTRCVSTLSPEREQMKKFLDLSKDMLVRSDQMNTDLSTLGINCMHTRTLVETGCRQIARIYELENTCDTGSVRATLPAFNTTLKSLRDAYRIILIREDLPPATAHGVLSMAQSLEVMVVQVSAV